MPADRTACELAQDYTRRKAAARSRQAAQVAAGQEIGSLPPIADPRRRAACNTSFRLFCETYFPERFYLRWSEDHLRVIARIEAAVLRGGLFAMAMPRGAGKTALAESAILWAALYGRHRFVAGLAASRDKSLEMLQALTMILETNDHIAADWPEVCLPIRELEGTANRCPGQTCGGVRTRITWTKRMLILPTVAGSPAAGVIIKVGGLTGGDVRGMHYTRADGQMVRPSLVVIDDPQTDTTARSATQNANRLSLLDGAVLGMAGPGKKLSAIMPCTVIQPLDMADEILKGEQHPDWNGMRLKMVNAWPTNAKLWDEYARLRAEGLRAGDEGHTGTEFYRQHREQMDTGAEATWPERFDADELSAIQHAVNLRLRDEAVFFAEYQNDPAAARAADELPTAEQIRQRVSGLPEWLIPTECQWTTAFIDTHDKLLYWLAAAWRPDFTGHVIAYGTWPDQHRQYFSLASAPRTLRRAHQGASREGAILSGLDALTGWLLQRPWAREDGATLPPGLILYDSGWETETVYQFIRRHPATMLLPSKGFSLRAASQPWEDRKHKPGERNGEHWRVGTNPGKGRGRLLFHDANWWKTFLQRRLATPASEPGAIVIHGAKRTDGTPANPDAHRLLSDHLTAERRVTTIGHGRAVDEWSLPPNRPDNHWLDCLVGCAVAASILGASAVPRPVSAGPEEPGRRVRQRVRYM